MAEKNERTFTEEQLRAHEGEVNSFEKTRQPKIYLHLILISIFS